VAVRQLARKLPFTFGEETQVNFFIKYREVAFKTMAFADIAT